MKERRTTPDLFSAIGLLQVISVSFLMVFPTTRPAKCLISRRCENGESKRSFGRRIILNKFAIEFFCVRYSTCLILVIYV
jgi:hypothetical protein